MTGRASHADDDDAPASFEELLASGDTDYDGYTSAAHDGPFPKVAHFIYTGEMEITWIEWLAVRGAIANLRADVKIWLDERLEPQGRIWERISRMERVTVRRVALPKSVLGLDIPDPAVQSDVFRLQILYTEGGAMINRQRSCTHAKRLTRCLGIYLENDIVPLKSSDNLFRDPKTRRTIMARRLDHESIPNWLVMSRPRAPFLKRWMLEYKGAHEQDGWQKLALKTPSDLAKDDSDITVLDGHSWFYPIASDPDGDAALKKLWFGKTWDEVDRSYGTHVWHWDEPTRQTITPQTIKTIDTPLFCALRPLLDGLSSGKKAKGRPNQNCTIVKVDELSDGDHRLFSDYLMEGDEWNMKWVDSSGFNHHGWAPKGTRLSEDKEGGVVRVIDKHSWAVLPVPLGWDSREWTARLDLKIQSEVLDSGRGFGLFKIRTRGEGEIVISIINKDSPAKYMMDVSWRDTPRVQKANGEFADGDSEQRWIPAEALRTLGETFHELAITYDRRLKGRVSVYLDGTSLGTERVPLLASPDRGLDIWINAAEFQELDLGFRGSLRRFTMYADALSSNTLSDGDSLPPVQSALSSFSSSAVVKNLDATHSSRFGGSMLLGLTIILVLVVLLTRSRKAFLREVHWYAREVIRKLRQFSDGTLRR